MLDAYLTSVRTVFGWIRDRLTPEHRFGGEPHPGLERWERLRTWATIALVVFTTVRYQGISAGRVMGAMDSTFASAELALFALVPAMAVLLVVARPDSRRRQAGALVRPLLTMLAVSAAYLALFSTIVAFRILSPAALHQASFLTGLLLNCSGLVIALAILLYAMPAVLWSLYLSARHWFRAADGHPLLPALTAVGFAAGQLALNLRHIWAGALDPDLPAWLAVGTAIGGPLVLAGTAAVEIALLRHDGIRFRTLPHRSRTG